MRFIWSAMCFCVTALILTGCRTKLDYEENVSLTPGEIKYLTIDPISNDQKVRVQVESKGKLNVNCYLEKDKEAIEKMITERVRIRGSSAKWLASKYATESADLEFTVPSNEKLIVRLWTTKNNANAKVTITNQ